MTGQRCSQSEAGQRPCRHPVYVHREFSHFYCPFFPLSLPHHTYKCIQRRTVRDAQSETHSQRRTVRDWGNAIGIKPFTKKSISFYYGLTFSAVSISLPPVHIKPSTASFLVAFNKRQIRKRIPSHSKQTLRKHPFFLGLNDDEQLHDFH